MKIIGLDTEYEQYIPFIATTCDTQLKSKLYDLHKEEDILELKELCESPDVNKVFHAATNDIYALSNAGIKVVPPYEDTYLMAPLLNENFDSKRLKILAKVHLNEPCTEEKELKKVQAKLRKEYKKHGIEFTWSMTPPEVMEPYAKQDPMYNIKLYFLFKNPVFNNYSVIYNFEKSLIPIIVKMMQTGMRIDRPFVKDMIEKYELEIDEIYNQMLVYLQKHNCQFIEVLARKTLQSIERNLIKEGADPIDITFDETTEYWTAAYAIPFKPTSTAHLTQAFKAFGYDYGKYTESSEKTDDKILATDAKTLKELPDDGSDGYKFVQLLIRFRFLFKQVSTYYKPLLDYYTSEEDDRAHFGFYQSGAKSGRFTAELIQTIPRKDEVEDVRFVKEVRKAFIPSTGRVLVFIDYDQIEMRLFAHFSNCTRLINDILAGYDPHTGTAINLFGEEKVLANKKKYRRMAKNINFGIIYGMGKTKLAATLGVPTREAFDILDDYYSKYPVKPYIQNLTGLLYKKGFVTLAVNSPLMHFTRDYRVPSDLAYKAVNIMIQGCAAYVMKFGMKRVSDYITEKYAGQIDLICSIHDELVFEVDKDIFSIDLVNELIGQMEDKISFKVPILASAKYSEKSWGDSIEIE